MALTSLDWYVVAGCLAVAFSPALFFMRRAGRGTTEFFTSGRSAPWWLIGTSMVATTFSTDTPNLVTDFVRSGGVAKNWVWWAFLLTGMMTVFFYARLWRRSQVLTDLEFYEIRYAGRPAALVRGFRAIYLGLLFNCVIMATVTLAAVKIANVMLGWSRWQTILVCSVICVLFSAMSGLWGVLASDMIQFVIAMVGVFAAAYYALDQPEVGGLSGLVEKLDPSVLSILPPTFVVDPATGVEQMNWSVLVPLLILPLTVQWWSVWYPGAEPGGGSYIAQRMLAAKNEKHAMGATLWFNVAHYALRPWPWIVVALCSMLVFPELQDIQRALPHVHEDLLRNDIAYPAMLTLLPHGLLGLLIASLASAYVSTMSTHLNWGASYLVHDFYRRFWFDRKRATIKHAGGAEDSASARLADERHLVWVARLVTAGLMILAAGFTLLLDTAGKAFDLLLSIGAGTGLIYLLRWYWWRINAFSEIAAMAASFAISAAFFIAGQYEHAVPSHVALLGTVFGTTTVWIVVTFLTAPTKRATLVDFYKLVRPPGPGWKTIRRDCGGVGSPDSLPLALLGWMLGCMMVYAALFGTGSFLYGQSMWGMIFLVVFIFSGAGLSWILLKVWGKDRLPT